MIGRILVFGDSIGQGYFDEVNGGWVRLLQRDFFIDYAAGKSDVNIINLSVSGHTSQEVLSRIEPEVSARANDEKMLIMIAVGVNDSYEKNGEYRTVESDYAHNVEKIIQVAKQFGEVLVIGLTSCVEKRVAPTSWNSDLYYTNARIKLYDKILQKEAEMANVPYVYLWQATYDQQNKEEIMPDGIHLNARGHQLLYDTIKPRLEEVLV